MTAMQPQAVTLIVAGMGIVGTLGGITVGHLLTRSSQRKQWIIDRRNDEFRELVKSIVIAMGKVGNAKDVLQPKTVDWVIFAHEASGEVYRTMSDRIFIAKDVERLDLKRQWGEAVNDYIADRVALRFGNSCRAMIDAIVATAIKDT